MLAIVSASFSWRIVLWLIDRSRQAQSPRSVTQRTRQAVLRLKPCPVRASTAGRHLVGKYHHLSTLMVPTWLLWATPPPHGYVVSHRAGPTPPHYLLRRCRPHRLEPVSADDRWLPQQSPAQWQVVPLRVMRRLVATPVFGAVTGMLF